MADNRIKIVIDVVGDKAKRAVKSVSSGFTELKNRVVSVNTAMTALAGGYVFSMLIRKLNDSADAASDFYETLSKVNTLFGDEETRKLRRWADEADYAMGLSAQSALDAVGTMGNMFLQLGSTQSAAAELSTGMVQLAADLASFHNVAGGSEEVLVAMQAAFRGEYDALQRYIPTISAATVQEQALAYTHKQSADDLTALDKALATHRIILRDAGAAAGDFGRTSGGLANQERILDAQLKDLSATIGESLLPVKLDIVSSINDWVRSNEDLIAQNIPEYVNFVKDASAALLTVMQKSVDLYNSLPDGIVGAAGAGLVGRWIFGKWGPAAMVAYIYEVNDAFEETYEALTKAYNLDKSRGKLGLLGDALRADEIDSVKAKIEDLKKKIAVDESDLTGWRAKVLGTDVYQQQLEEHLSDMERLQQRLAYLEAEQYNAGRKIASSNPFGSYSPAAAAGGGSAAASAAAAGSDITAADLRKMKALGFSNDLETILKGYGSDVWGDAYDVDTGGIDELAAAIQTAAEAQNNYRLNLAESIELQTRMKDAVEDTYDVDAGGKTAYQEELEKQNAEFEKLVDAEEKASQRMIELSKRTAWAMQENFSNLFFDAMTGELDSFRDYAIAVLTSIQKAVSDYMGQLVTSGLFGSNGSGGLLQSALSAVLSGIGGSVSSYAPAHVGAGGTTAFSMDGGGYIGEDILGIGRRSGQSYEFHADEVIMPTSKMGGGGQTVVNNYYITNDIKANDAKSFNDMLSRSNAHVMGMVGAGMESNSSLRNQVKKAAR